MTLRVLHTDCHEVFSADHGLTFRGLPAEGLGDHSHEAASLPTPPVGTCGAPQSGQRDGLSAGSGASPNAGALGRGTLPAASPLFRVVPRLPLARFARSREGASWRPAGEPSWFAPPSRSPLPVLPALAPPIAAAVACSKGLGKGSHRLENLAFAVPGPIFLVVSRGCRHGSRCHLGY